MSSEEKSQRVQHLKTATVDGQQQTTALLDTGSFMSFAKSSLVPVGSVDDSRQAGRPLCVHGDIHPYPKAEVTVNVDGQPYLLTVGVVENLPMAAILGRDLPVLMD